MIGGSGMFRLRGISLFGGWIWIDCVFVGLMMVVIGVYVDGCLFVVGDNIVVSLFGCDVVEHD